MENIWLFLYKAIMEDSKSDVKSAIEHCNKNKLSIDIFYHNFGITPLYQATMLRRVSIVKYLLKNGANPLIPDKLEEKTAFHDVALKGDCELLELLCKAPIFKHIPLNLNVLDKDSKTPLQLAVQKANSKKNAPHIHFIELLFKYGANPNFIGKKNDKTPLQLASERGRSSELVKILIDHEANPTGICPMTEKSVLHLAINTNNSLVVEKLLDHGANPSLVCPDTGKTPYELAMENKNKRVISVLSYYDLEFSKVYQKKRKRMCHRKSYC